MSTRGRWVVWKDQNYVHVVIECPLGLVQHKALLCSFSVPLIPFSPRIKAWTTMTHPPAWKAYHSSQKTAFESHKWNTLSQLSLQRQIFTVNLQFICKRLVLIISLIIEYYLFVYQCKYFALETTFNLHFDEVLLQTIWIYKRFQNYYKVLASFLKHFVWLYKKIE